MLIKKGIFSINHGKIVFRLTKILKAAQRTHMSNVPRSSLDMPLVTQQSQILTNTGELVAQRSPSSQTKSSTSKSLIVVRFKVIQTCYCFRYCHEFICVKLDDILNLQLQLNLILWPRQMYFIVLLPTISITQHQFRAYFCEIIFGSKSSLFNANLSQPSNQVHCSKDLREQIHCGKLLLKRTFLVLTLTYKRIKINEWETIL